MVSISDMIELFDFFATEVDAFSDEWSKVTDAATNALAPIKVFIGDIINTNEFQGFINGLIIGFDLLRQGAEWFVNTLIQGWDTIGPMLAYVGTIVLAAYVANLWATIPPILAQAAAWLLAAFPLLLIIAIIAIVISAVLQLGGTWEGIFGFIGGVIGVFVGHFYNCFVRIWNTVAAFINFFGNVFTNTSASIKALFFDLAVNVLGFIEKIAQGIETVLNKIPGIEVDITSNLTNLKDLLAKESATIKSEAELTEFVKSKDYVDYSDSFTKGSDMGKNVFNKVSDGFSSLTDVLTEPSGNDFSNFGTKSNPLNVTETGNDAGKVDMSDEDLQYLRDIAERDYIAKVSANTLAPNITVTFGDVHETADVDNVAGRIKKILQEQIAMSSEGVYA